MLYASIYSMKKRREEVIIKQTVTEEVLIMPIVSKPLCSSVHQPS